MQHIGTWLPSIFGMSVGGEKRGPDSEALSDVWEGGSCSCTLPTVPGNVSHMTPKC